jgi:hypothetical protein
MIPESIFYNRDSGKKKESKVQCYMIGMYFFLLLHDGIGNILVTNGLNEITIHITISIVLYYLQL